LKLHGDTVYNRFCGMQISKGWTTEGLLELNVRTTITFEFFKILVTAKVLLSERSPETQGREERTSAELWIGLLPSGPLQ